ncbi:hypothetical protein FRC15_002021 [Serendipita sp. 397]|nr:hypothetical protein FRC15_002021 [Serendipita sp. 397]
MRGPPSSGQQGGQPPHDYDRRRGSPPPPSSSSHLPPQRGNERRYDPLQEDRGGPFPPRQTSPFHPTPMKHQETSPVGYYDERDQREGAGSGYAHDSRRRSARSLVDKDELESVSGTEKGRSKKRTQPHHPPHQHQQQHQHQRAGPNSQGGYANAFSAPPPPRSPLYTPQPSSAGGGNEYEGGRGRPSHTSTGSYGGSAGGGGNQRYPSEGRQQQPVPPLVPNKAGTGAPASATSTRKIDDDYDDSPGEKTALMGLAELSASVTSTPAGSSYAPGPPASTVTASGGRTSPGSVSPPVMHRLPAVPATSETALSSRKRRRSGSGSSTDQGVSAGSVALTSNAASGAANSAVEQPDKKKQRLEIGSPPTPLGMSSAGGSGGRERTSSVSTNGRSRPSLPRIQTRERSAEDGQIVDDEMQQDSSTESPKANGDPGSANGTGNNMVMSPKPISRTNTNSSPTPVSAASQDTMRNRSTSPTATTPTMAKSLNKDRSPSQKSVDEKDRRSVSLAHSRSTSLNVNGAAKASSPAS